MYTIRDISIILRAPRLRNNAAHAILHVQISSSEQTETMYSVANINLLKQYYLPLITINNP